MTRNARVWTGLTVLVIVTLNYAVIGFPLIKKSASLQDRAKAILIKQVKSGAMLKDSEDEYILEIFRKEKRSIDQKISVLNVVATSLLIIVASWTVFGLIVQGKRK